MGQFWVLDRFRSRAVLVLSPNIKNWSVVGPVQFLVLGTFEFGTVLDLGQFLSGESFGTVW